MRAMPSTSGVDPKLKKLCLCESRWTYRLTQTGNYDRQACRLLGQIVVRVIWSNLVILFLSYSSCPTRLYTVKIIETLDLHTFLPYLALLSQSMKTCQNLSLNLSFKRVPEPRADCAFHNESKTHQGGRSNAIHSTGQG